MKLLFLKKPKLDYILQNKNLKFEKDNGRLSKRTQQST